MIKRSDIIIFAAVIAAAAAIFGIFRLNESNGTSVLITENNQTVYKGSIHTDKTVKLSGNTVVIKNGYATVSKADCKNQICVNHKKISKKGETMVCLPNKVIVEIK